MTEDFTKKQEDAVHTVLGPVAAEELGVVLPHEALLSMVPGAEIAPEIDTDESKQFETLRRVLIEYRRLGGKTIVDRGGMFKGRNVLLYRALSRETGVHLVASTGLGPASMVGSYFTTQQTDPPGPMPLDRLSDMYAKEITEGAVVPRRERTGPAGIICTEASRDGITAFEEHLYRGSARAGLETGAAVSMQAGKDPAYELDILEKEGLDLQRVIVGGLDRLDTDERGDAFTIARRGAMIALDHVGWTLHEGYVSDDRRVQVAAELIAEGLGDRVLLSSNAVGCAVGHEASRVGFDHVLTSFIPMLKKAGVTGEQVRQLVEDNPQRILALKGKAAHAFEGKGADITWVK